MVPFWLAGEFTTHVRTYFSGWIGMFTGGTIGHLTHGHFFRTGVNMAKVSSRCRHKLGEGLEATCRQLAFGTTPGPRLHGVVRQELRVEGPARHGLTRARPGQTRPSCKYLPNVIVTRNESTCAVLAPCELQIRRMKPF